MDLMQELQRIMASQTEVAIASAVNGEPNVRIVSFYFCNKHNKLFFSSFKGAPKEQEFATNGKVAFTTIPQGHIEHVRAQGTIELSEKTVVDFRDKFVEKNPGMGQLIDQAGANMNLYRVTFDKATVILGMQQGGVVDVPVSE